MKIEAVPEETKKKYLERKKKRDRFDVFDWETERMDAGIAVVTHGERGILKPGIKGWIIGGQERKVFVNSEFQIIPEFLVVTETGSQFLGQYGRDIKFLEE